MKYNTDLILDQIRNDYNDDYLVYFETSDGYYFANDVDYFLTGKTALEYYKELCDDFKVKYVELLYDPAQDEELEDRIVLMSCEKKVFDIFGNKVYIE